jgi:putative Mg2+ transporter-C (MgtC) family protein
VSGGDLLLRMVTAVVFGTLVGIERQWHHKTAGVKTNTLVALGAAAFTILAQVGFGPANVVPQVAAGVVTGIGFIGGGVIMRRAGSVQGINSAATLWATASIGLATGAGCFGLAWIVLALVLLIQFVEISLAQWIDSHSPASAQTLAGRLSVRVTDAGAARVRDVWNEFASRPGVKAVDYDELCVDASEVSVQASMLIEESRSRELTLLAQQLAALAGVRRAGWSHLRRDDSSGEN